MVAVLIGGYNYIAGTNRWNMVTEIFHTVQTTGHARGVLYFYYCRNIQVAIKPNAVNKPTCSCRA